MHRAFQTSGISIAASQKRAALGDCNGLADGNFCDKFISSMIAVAASMRRTQAIRLAIGGHIRTDLAKAGMFAGQLMVASIPSYFIALHSNRTCTNVVFKIYRFY